MRRYHAHYHTSGEEHIYQGRFKSFPVQDDGHFLTVYRYVERNALRAELLARACGRALQRVVDWAADFVSGWKA